jgi:hypothetical protein
MAEGDRDDEMPVTPLTSSPQQVSPDGGIVTAHQLFLERESEQWRDQTEQRGPRARIAASWSAGPTVDEEINVEDFETYFFPR